MREKVQSKNRVNYEQVDTIVSSEVVYVGDITSGGSIRYEGTLNGNITISGNLIVGRNALITGNIKAENVHVIGTVEGDINCDQLKILSTGKITGNAEINTLIIDEGSVFIGNMKTRLVEDKDPSINDLLKVVE